MASSRSADLVIIGGGISGTALRFAAALAKKMGMTKSWLSQLIGKNSVREIGDRAARNIEKVLNLQEGWLDSNHAGPTVDQDILTQAVLLVLEATSEKKVNLPPKKIALLIEAIYTRLETGTVSRAAVHELVDLAS